MSKCSTSSCRAVGDQVLKAAGRLTAIGTLKNRLAQGLRNAVSRLLLGVAHAVADTMSKITIGFVDSPLNGPGLHDGPRPGERLTPIAGEPATGRGDQPLFALYAAPGEDVQGLLARFPGLLDPRLRAPLRPGTIWLVRPDGYVAASATAEDLESLSSYISRLTGLGPSPTNGVRNQ